MFLFRVSHERPASSQYQRAGRECTPTGLLRSPFGASWTAHTHIYPLLFVCPSSTQRQVGLIDYGGNFGSSQTGLIPGLLIGEAWESGALISINVGGALGRTHPARLGEFTDGLSSTFLVLECAERPILSGFWGCGGNTMGIEYPINSHPEGETIKSKHPQGGHALFCDGHVAFFSNSTDLELLGRLSTRAGNEVAQP